MLEPKSVFASVPAGPFLEEVDGETVVAWGTARANPDGGRVLEEFTALASLEESEVGLAVCRFVRRFGNLGLCREHERCHLSVEHIDCERIYPEPIPLWVKFSREVSSVLHVRASLDAGEDPDPFNVKANPSLMQDTPGLESFRLRAERLRRAGEATSDQVADFSEDLDRREDEFRRFKQKGGEEIQCSKEEISRLQPSTPQEWREWISSRVNEGLWQWPTEVRLTRDLTTELHPSPTVLSKVYWELAREVSGVGRIVFCSWCDTPYTPAKAPKKGQRNYCPGCREAGIPQRLYMRRRRSRQ